MIREVQNKLCFEFGGSWKPSRISLVVINVSSALGGMFLVRTQAGGGRGVKEVVHIKANKPSLNKDGGRYKLSGVYEAVIRSKVKKIDAWYS